MGREALQACSTNEQRSPAPGPVGRAGHASISVSVAAHRRRSSVTTKSTGSGSTWRRQSRHSVRISSIIGVVANVKSPQAIIRPRLASEMAATASSFTDRRVWRVEEAIDAEGRAVHSGDPCRSQDHMPSGRRRVCLGIAGVSIACSCRAIAT